MTAAMQGAIRPLVNRFSLGAFEVTTILDGTQIRGSISPPFGIDQPAASVAQLAAENLLPVTGFESSYTPVLVNIGDSLILFDAGNELSRRPNGAGFLGDRLALAGYAPEDIDIVAFTHGHPDHIGGIMTGDRLTFPNARYVIGQREYDAWINGGNIPERRAESRALFLKLVPPIAPKTTFLNPGDDIVTGIRAIEAHGHSLGHLAYHVESNGQSLIIWGDLANHYAFSLQRPRWHFALDDDREQAVVSRLRLLDMIASEKLLATGFHMPFPAVGYVERSGDGYRWLPMTYQARF